MKQNYFPLIIFIIIILTIKFFYLFIIPIDQSLINHAANTFIFYNLKSFLITAQSFHDWNHPGTPIYMFLYLVNFITNITDFNNYDKFIYTNHLINLAFYFLSFLYFSKILFSYSKNNNNIYLFFQYSCSVHTLEIIDPTNYLFPLMLVLVVEIDKFM